MDEAVAKKVVQVVIEAGLNKASFTEAQATARGYLTGLGGVAGGTGTRISGGGVTSAALLQQKQMAQERSIEQLLAAHGITASPGAGKLSAKDLGALGLTQEELASVGMAKLPRKGVLGSGPLGWEERRALSFAPGVGGFAGMLGMSGPMMGVAAGAIAIGGLATVAGDLVSRYRDEVRSMADLRTATDNAGLNFKAVDSGVEAFINRNKEYIDSVSSAREGFAELTRSGLDQTLVQKAMADAVQLSAAKHISLAQAVELVDMAEQGNSRGLRDLGIQVKDYTDLTLDGAAAQKKVTDATLAAKDADLRVQDAHIKLKDAIDKYGASSDQAKLAQNALTIAVDTSKKAHGNLSSAQAAMTSKSQSQTALLGDLNTKTHDYANNLDPLQKATNKYNADMDRLAHDVGPALLTALSGLVNAVDWAVQNIFLAAGTKAFKGDTAAQNPMVGIGGSWASIIAGRGGVYDPGNTPRDTAHRITRGFSS